MKLAIPLIVGAGVLAIGFLQWRISQRPTPTVTEESDAQRTESLQGAFRPTVDGTIDARATQDPVLLAAADAFIDRVGAAYRGANADAIEGIFNFEATLAYAEEAGIVDLGSMRPTQKMRFRAGMRQGFAQGMTNNARMLSFEDDATVVRVEEIEAGEMIVYFRATSVPFQVGIKHRYWLLRDEDGTWRTYDYEDLETGARMTALVGSLLASGLETPPEWVDALMDLSRANQRLAAAPDPYAVIEEIRKPVEALLAYDLPAPIEAYTRVLLAGPMLAVEDWEGVLGEVDRIAELNGGAPLLDFMRGRSFAGLGRYDEALEAYARYAEILGSDAQTHEAVADCLYFSDDREGAVAEAEKGLALDPEAIGCLSTLALCVPAEGRAGVIQRVRALSEPALGYELILDFALQNEETEAYAAYRAALVEDDPESALLQIYE